MFNKNMEDLVGLPLECYMSFQTGQPMLACMNENGEEFIYKGPANSTSDSTIFGIWTGISPFANDIPVKVMTRYGKKTSALDSFSMLYTIQCYDQGYHVSSINEQYIQRIQAAVDRGVISTYRDMAEFTAASRILDSFYRSGHIFHIVNNATEFHHSTELGSFPKSMQFVEDDAKASYPLFTLNEDEEGMVRDALERSNISVSSTEDVLSVLKEAGMESTYMYHWFKKKYFEQMRTSFAMTHVSGMMNQLRPTQRHILPSWDRRSHKSQIGTKKQLHTILESLGNDITSEILQGLL
jgi:hypothetical protein